jgi:hypothetical protein
MTKRNDKVEIAAENLLKEITRVIRSFRKFVFNIPKKKEERMIYVLDIIAWTALSISLVFRIGR